MANTLTPSVVCLPGSFTQKASLLNRLECERVHVDIAAAPNQFGFIRNDEFGIFERTLFRSAIDFHVFSFSKGGVLGTLPLRTRDTVLLHVFPWMTEHWVRNALAHFAQYGIKVGIALDVAAPISVVIPHIEMLNSILIMAITAGSRGRPPDPRSHERVHQLRSLVVKRNPEIQIGLDGGVNSTTFKSLSESVDFLVVGSFLFDADDLPKQWAMMSDTLKAEKSTRL